MHAHEVLNAGWCLFGIVSAALLFIKRASTGSGCPLWTGDNSHRREMRVLDGDPASQLLQYDVAR